jgi:hypothetical protein
MPATQKRKKTKREAMVSCEGWGGGGSTQRDDSKKLWASFNTHLSNILVSNPFTTKPVIKHTLRLIFLKFLTMVGYSLSLAQEFYE